ncbi:mannosyl-oligosaccharide alpha-1,2-mannosidase [Thraustotheca clavata]|uniref:alpha-1,2-Mannosidase n=1 Tax=Thraustotheca clavata TaxID=74557 RepID=A0A1W0AAD6_9STRA|nr:mannosyl-oligosaccharide alpha-1,2-mannosidase [Thraustotheca clavata]
MRQRADRAQELPQHTPRAPKNSSKSHKNTCLITAAVLFVSVVVFVCILGELPLPERVQYHLGVDSMPLHVRQYLKRCSKDYHDANTSGNAHLFAQKTQNKDQENVIKAAKWAWSAYQTHAFGEDVYDSRIRKGHAWNDHNLGITMIDSLDTLFILGMHDEFDQALAWVRDQLPAKLSHGGSINVFETTIRVLGGLLSAYHLTGKHELLAAADAVGQRLSQAFVNTPAGFPHPLLNLWNGKGNGGNNNKLADVGTLQLEFRYLTQLTCNQKYRDAVDKVMDQLLYEMDNRFPDGLVPVIVDVIWGGYRSFCNSLFDLNCSVDDAADISFGANGDSYYEYLLKQWLFTDKQESRYKEAYEKAIESMNEKMVRTANGESNLTIVGSLVLTTDYTYRLVTKMDHLSCFLPGLLALGNLHGMPSWHMDLAKRLMTTCYMMYHEMPSGLAPEDVYFVVDGEDEATPVDHNPMKHNNPNYDPYFRTPDFFFQVEHPANVNMLRPETIESLMIMYHTTQDEIYREWGREIFSAFEEHAKLDTGGYASVHRLHLEQPRATHGIMESFFIAETLKYFYFLFADTKVVKPLLENYVFNTEAHPFPILRFQSSAKL